MTLEELNKSKKVARLIIGYLNKDLRPQEREELDNWLSEDVDNVALFEKLTDKAHLEESIRWFKALDREAMKDDGKNFVGKKTNSLMWVAAAVIFLGIGLWIFRYGFEDKVAGDKRKLVSTDSVMPGGFRAVLVTASGEKVSLGSRKEISVGKGAVAKDEGEQLVYSPNVESSVNTLQVPAGGQFQVVLSDGTKVWLNSMSALRYPTSFNDSLREVELEGEGYFEVAKNRKQTFEVRCGSNVMVQVTGTEFNINSYGNLAERRITLIGGSINLRVNNRSLAMRPGQQGTVSGDEAVNIVNESNAAESIAWTKGLFSFNKTSIEEVMHQLSRWYNITVMYEGRPNKQFTGNIPMKSSIQSALQMLEISGDVHFTLSGKTVTVRP